MTSDETLADKYLNKIAELLNLERDKLNIIALKTGNQSCLFSYVKDRDGGRYCISYNLENPAEFITKGYNYGDSRFIASFTLGQLPGCCAYIISTQAAIGLNYRNKGLGTLLNLFRIEIGKYMGYSALLCTDIDTNEAQRKILNKNGWKDVHKIRNKRTHNLVYLSVIEL